MNAVSKKQDRPRDAPVKEHNGRIMLIRHWDGHYDEIERVLTEEMAVNISRGNGNIGSKELIDYLVWGYTVTTFHGDSYKFSRWTQGATL